MNTRSRPDQKYLDDLLLHLRMRDVPGARIGEILAEVEAHSAASGETLQEAFGDPKAYAAQWAPSLGRPSPRSPRYWLPKLPGMVFAGAGGWALADGAFSIGNGAPSLFGLPGIWVALIGCLVLAASVATIPVDRVVDPRTGEQTTAGKRTLVMVFVALFGTVAVLMVAMGLLL